MATSTAWAPRSASRPTSCTRAGRWASKASPRSSTWSSATAKCASEAVIPRLAILGGTFDPVHNAHLSIARHALESLEANALIWLPTGAPPYRKPPVASAAQRVAMLRLALAGEPRYRIDERELRAAASGYTYDSMVALSEAHPDDELVLVMGADQYSKRDSWYRWRDLEKICRIAVAARPDFPAPEGNMIPIALPSSPISASDIRERIGRGEDLSAIVPASVLKYIGEHRLYR